MKFIRCFFTDIKRMLFNIYFIAGTLVLSILCLLSNVYYDFASKREYSVLEAFLKFRTEDDYHISAEYISTVLSGNFVFMFIIIIAAFPFVNVICDERKSGARHYYLQRTGIFRYSASKILASLVSSALLCALGYIAAVVAVYILMPSINSMSEEQQEVYNTIFDTSCFQSIANITVLGVSSCLITLIITAFVHNKYFCLCIPFFINYIRQTLSTKLFLNSVYSENVSQLSQIINPASARYIITENDLRVQAAVFYGIMLVTAWAAFYIMQKRSIRNGT